MNVVWLRTIQLSNIIIIFIIVIIHLFLLNSMCSKVLVGCALSISDAVVICKVEAFLVIVRSK